MHRFPTRCDDCIILCVLIILVNFYITFVWCYKSPVNNLTGNCVIHASTLGEDLPLPRCASSSAPPLPCQPQARTDGVKLQLPGLIPAAPTGGGVNMARAPNTFRMHWCHLSQLTTAPLSAIWVYYQYISPHIMMFSLALVL